MRFTTNIINSGVNAASYIYNLMRNYADKLLISQLKNSLHLSIKDNAISGLDEFAHVIKKDLNEHKTVSQENRDQIIKQALDIDDTDSLSFAIVLLDSFINN